MAPELNEKKVYDGRQVDMFALGVILFIIVRGKLPFKQAVSDDSYYSLLLAGKFDKYWQKCGGTDFSDDLKDLILKLLSHNPKDRPDIKQFKKHPWMQKPFDIKETK